jgi:hypothetical protein
MAGDGRAVRPHGDGPAVELGDAETPDFLLICRFERQHEAFPSPVIFAADYYPSVKM